MYKCTVALDKCIKLMNKLVFKSSRLQNNYIHDNRDTDRIYHGVRISPATFLLE